MRRLLRNLLIGGFLATFVLLLGYFNATKPRILVVHSAAQHSQWAVQVDKGMRKALQRNRRPVSVEWIYLDVSSPAGGRSAVEARAEAMRAIGRTDPDVLITVDDEANALVGSTFVGLESPRVLYVSVDRPPAVYGYPGARNVSGIADALPWAAIRDALTDLFGPRPTVAVLGVDNDSGRAELDQLRAADWGPVAVQQADLVATAPAWRDAVSAAAGVDALVILATHDLPDGSGGVTRAADLSRWTQDNAVALPIGTEVDFVADGGALSFAPPPEFYGEEAISLALDWLDDRQTPGPPAAVSSSHFEVAMRQELLARRGIVLPPIYAEAARENGTLFG